jgi:hypothetical protein
MKKFTVHMICLSTLALGIASAASSYDVTLYNTVSVGGTELKAGEYKVEMQGDKAVFKSGKKSFQIPATLSSGDKKFGSTSLLSSNSKLTEIDLGGTKDKIVFSAGAGPSSNGN